jgi:predicted NUDIX family phosphoesterase
VHLLELRAPDVRSRESALAEAGFSSLAELLADRDDFETWSRFVLDELAAAPLR